MTRTRWIVFILICTIILGALAFISKKDAVDVSTANPTTIVAETETAIGDHFYGNKDAKVMLVEYGDFQCPACGGAFPQLKTIKETYKGEIAFIFRNFPLTAIHPNALAAAAVAEAAGLQGKFWEMHDKLYEEQESWSNAQADQRDDFFASYAEALGLNMETYRSDLTSKKVNEKIARDQALGRKLKVDATPALFVGDERLGGDATSNLVRGNAEDLIKQLDAAIKQSGGTVPKRN